MNIKKLQAAWGKRCKLRAEGDKLYTERDKLYAERDKLYAESDIIWYSAIMEICGPKTEVTYNDDACTLRINQPQTIRFVNTWQSEK